MNEPVLDRYLGGVGLVVGTGPSAALFNGATRQGKQLDGYDVIFGLNGAIQVCSIDYWLMADPDVYNHAYCYQYFYGRGAFLSSHMLAAKHLTKERAEALCPWTLKSNTPWTQKYPWQNGFERTWESELVMQGTIAHAAVHLGWVMGLKRLDLIGVDFRRDVGGRKYWNSEPDLTLAEEAVIDSGRRAMLILLPLLKGMEVVNSGNPNWSAGWNPK